MGSDKSTYDPAVALKICELVAEGKTLRNISKRPEFPSRPTIYRWMILTPKFLDAYERAKELSAQSFEDEALDMARELREPNDFTGTKVQAYNIAMGQLRWSAARRDKTRYGQQVQGQTTVPIQINTTLNLGQEGQGPPTSDTQSIYTVEATVLLGSTPEEYDDSVQATTVEGLISDATMIDLEPEPGDNDDPTPATPKPSAKPKPGHKSPAATKRTAKVYARKA